MKRAESRVIPLFALATLLGGCTAGQVVDSNMQPLPVGKGALTFVGVNGDNTPNGSSFVYQFAGDTSTDGSYVSFDSYAPETMANVSGIRNTPQQIPPGRFYVHLDREVGLTSGAGGGNGANGKNYVSGIFTHQYTANCNDAITGNVDPHCALYYFQVLEACGGDGNIPCCYGDQLCVTPTPLPTSSATPIIQLQREYP